MVLAVLTGRSTGSGFDLAWFSSLTSDRLCIFGLRMLNFLKNSILYLLVSWAWWDWPLTWLTKHFPSVLWHCWLGHLTRKIIPEMTYSALSEMLNPTVLYYTFYSTSLMSDLINVCFTMMMMMMMRMVVVMMMMMMMMMILMNNSLSWWWCVLMWLKLVVSEALHLQLTRSVTLDWGLTLKFSDCKHSFISWIDARSLGLVTSEM